MPPSTRSGTEKSDEILSFFKSDKFSSILQEIINKETITLNAEIASLRSEVNILKETNIELIHLLNNKNEVLNVYDMKNTETKKEAAKTAFYSEAVRKTNTDKEVERKVNLTNSKKSEINNPKVKEIENIELLQDNENDWTVKVNKRKFKKLDVVTGVDKKAGTIKGVHKYGHLHVYRLDPVITEEDLINYVKSKNINEVKCEKLNSKFPDIYSSFKVSVPSKYFEVLLKPEMWPEEVCVNRFLTRLAKNQTKT